MWVSRAAAVTLAAALCLPAALAEGRGGAHQSGALPHSSAPNSKGSTGAHSSITSGHSLGKSTGHPGAQSSPGGHGHPKAAGAHRDAHGKIEHSEQAKNDFKKSQPCPSTGKSSGSCPGYVIDHVTPLKRGGADAPYNMRWQAETAAKAKDGWEYFHSEAA